MSSEILVSLSASCLLHPLPRQQSPIALLDIPRFVSEELEVRGINIPVQMIRGQPAQTLERFRDEADRAQCPCLVLYRDEPLDLCADAEKSLTTLKAMARAAKLLDCSEIAVRIHAIRESMATIAPIIKTAIDGLQRSQVNLLVRPCDSPHDTPEDIIGLIRRIGGFHIGAMPSFANARGNENGLEAVRQLTPYASAIEATVTSVDDEGCPGDDQFDDYIDAVMQLGFSNKLSIDWRGKGNWAQAVQLIRGHVRKRLGQEDVVA